MSDLKSRLKGRKSSFRIAAIEIDDEIALRVREPSMSETLQITGAPSASGKETTLRDQMAAVARLVVDPEGNPEFVTSKDVQLFLDAFSAAEVNAILESVTQQFSPSPKA